MMRRLRFAIPLALCSISAVVLFAAPAGAQQLVDAGKEGGSGGLAFVLFAAMVMICGGALFFMDHVRRSRLHEDEDAPQ